MNVHLRNLLPPSESAEARAIVSANRLVSLRAFVFLLALACMICVERSAAQESSNPSEQDAPARLEQRSPGRFEGEIRAFEQQDERDPPPKNAVLFVGSSSFVGWKTLHSDFPQYATINRGFGGSEITDVIHYADRIVLPYAPRLIVLYAGDNDIAAGKSPGQVADDYLTFVKRVRGALPQTRIVFIAIKPSTARQHLIERMRAANTLIKFYARSDERLGFADVFEPMLDAAGNPRPELFVEDGLHMNARGYDLWKRIVEPHLAHP